MCSLKRISSYDRTGNQFNAFGVGRCNEHQGVVSIAIAKRYGRRS